MVSSTFVDAISDPTQALEELYAQNNAPDGFPARVSAHFTHIFASKDAFSEIPSIHAIDPRRTDRRLVKGRFMIQDNSASPELYIRQRSDGKCGGWGLVDASTDDETAYAPPRDANELGENTVVWAVNIPHESNWVSAEIDGPNAAPFTPPTVTESHPHKFPDSGARHLGVQVKVYDATLGDSLKATDVLTLVGIYSLEPVTADIESVHVPTLHVLFLQRLPETLVPRVFPAFTDASAVKSLRAELISWIADAALAGDKLSAEWVLLSTIARVQSRTPPILPPSLTISNFPSSDTRPKLLFVLAQLFPIVDGLELSLDMINTSSFAPESKNEDLHSGRLQLPRGSVCVVSEGGVTEGGIVQRGMQNLQALQNAMSSQTLDYVFPFSRFSFHTDISFVVLAEGRKSTFFQTHNIVPFKAETADLLYGPVASVQLPSEEKLALFRELVGGARLGKVTVDDDVAEHIQEDFVAERKSAASPVEAVTSEDLIRRMTIARLIAMSFHTTVISRDIWEQVKALESRRKFRLDSVVVRSSKE
ncbi:hypothetical protein MKEN_01177000 [Mycena kentingensis (nom. inval.)]|nr:hypothetical protein MKEN_01177000 [Mycena kentingensis (nom. inval.)]